MTTPAAQTTATVADGREPTPPGAPPGAPPEGAPFQSALETEQARTATAEGQQQSHSERPCSATSHSTPVHRARSAGVVSSSTVPAPLSPSSTAGTGLPSGALAPPCEDDPAANTPAASIPSANDPTASTPAASDPAVDIPAATITAGEPDTSAAHNTGAGASVLPAARASEGSPAAAKGAGAVPGAHTGALPSSDSAAIAENPALPTSGGAVTSWVGHDSSTSQDKASQDKASPLPPRAAAAGAALGATARTEGASTGGGGWTQEGTNAGGGDWTQAGAHRAVEQQYLRSAGAAGAHDKLWVPDPALTSPGAGAGGGTATGGTATGGVGAAGTGVLAAGSGSAQAFATPGADPQGPLLDYGVGLQQAIETLHGTIQLAARQGLSQARIALEPEGLGEIRVHLTQTAQGLLARVTAETPVAAQALAAAHAELRQSLSSLGLNLARLDVGRHGHATAQGGGTALGGGGRDGATGGGEASSRGTRSGQTDATATPSDPAPGDEVQTNAQPEPAPLRGALIDVLA
jgi:Flagellar hook-length control protein FliK